jgi:Domain of unknown function (DUF4394)
MSFIANGVRIACAIALGLLVTEWAHAAPLIYGYDATDGRLVSFYADQPSVLVGDLPLTGLGAFEVLVGIDARPVDGEIYGLAVDGTISRLVTIDRATGEVASVGVLIATPLGSLFGFDVNPVPDRIRLVSDADANQRINPNDGSLLSPDVPLEYAAGDVHEGVDPNVVHVAYTNSVAGAVTTTLYGIDAALDSLVIINPPNNGTLNTVGPLGIDTNGVGGFDIEPGTNAAYAALRVGGVSSLYAINLSTGFASLIGTIGAGPINGIAIAPEAGSLASALCAVAMLGWLRRRARS